MVGNCQPNVPPNDASASHTVRLGRGCTCQTRGRLGNLGHLEGELGRSMLRLSGHAVYRDEIVVQWPASYASRSSESFSVGGPFCCSCRVRSIVIFIEPGY